MNSSSAILENFRLSHGKDIDLTLREPYRQLLEKLGNPQEKLPPVVHVAGTNGKGSTCAFLRAIIEAAGYKAHVYTSPHLVDFKERIRIAGSLISESELFSILRDCEKLAERGGVSYFEAATAAAFVAFANHPADITILEVGLGGRLDATNIVSKKAATVISRLSFDHREYLGNTIHQIAAEKAGILRAGTPCFTSPQPSLEALDALRQESKKLGISLFVGGEDWNVTSINDNYFRFTSTALTIDLPTPALIGQHQLWNAGLAISALPIKVNESAIKQAMLNVEWPARLQQLKHGNLSRTLPSGWELWLDGGHNDSAGEILATHAKHWQIQDGKNPKPLHIICGMLSTKSPNEFLSPIAPYVKKLRAVTIENEPLSLINEEMANIAINAGIPDSRSAQGIKQALSDITKSSPDIGRILICGSLYLAGNTLRAEFY